MTNPTRFKFLQQRVQAGRRGIQFNLTYEQWLDFWGSDLPQRGRGAGKLVMGRYGDTGAYELGNIYKVENVANIMEPTARQKLIESRWTGRRLVIQTDTGLRLSGIKQCAAALGLTKGQVIYKIKIGVFQRCQD